MRLAAALVSVAALSAGAGASTGQLEPATPVTSFSAVVRYPGGSELVAWRSPERFSVRLVSGRPRLGWTLERSGTIVYRYSQMTQTSILAHAFAARPDGSPAVDQLRWPLDFVLAQVRKGALKLRPDGADAWRVRLYAPANKCAGFRSGSLELRLRRADLLPLRLVERHGEVVHDLAFTHRSVNRALPAGTFAPAKATRVAHREDEGFVRSSPSAAARKLSYTPLLPTALPDGFRLAVSGWATRSATTGAEGSIPPSRELFAAVYRRGLEHVDVTERLAAGRGWPDDPFGAECVRQFTERARIGSATAVYAAGLSTTPHLYWRSARLLYTVSGPFPKAQLLEIARSLAPVS